MSEPTQESDGKPYTAYATEVGGNCPAEPNNMSTATHFQDFVQLNEYPYDGHKLPMPWECWQRAGYALEKHTAEINKFISRDVWQAWPIKHDYWPSPVNSLNPRDMIVMRGEDARICSIKQRIVAGSGEPYADCHTLVTRVYLRSGKAAEPVVSETERARLIDLETWTRGNLAQASDIAKRVAEAYPNSEGAAVAAETARCHLFFLSLLHPKPIKGKNNL